MKKIYKESVMEDAKYFCDVHPDIECFSKIEGISWYGSRFDMMNIEMHLCDKCLTDFYKHIQEKYKIEPKEFEI